MASGGSPGWEEDGRAFRLIRHDPASPADASAWPATVPAVAQVLREDLNLPAGLTVLVGENGSGKSTIVEIAGRSVRAQPAGRVGPGTAISDQGQ